MTQIPDLNLLSQDESSSVRRTTRKSFSLMIGNYWLIISFIILVLGFILSQVPLILVAILFFFTGSVARLWERYCLARIEFQRNLSAERAFFGDEISLEISVANRKPLPLPWFQIEEEIPADLTYPGDIASPVIDEEVNTVSSSVNYGWFNRDNRANISNYISLGWYNKITRRYRVICDKRGLFAFGPTFLRSGDLFGIFTRDMYIKKQNHLIVYPKIVSVEQLGIPSRQLFGDIRTKSHIFEDPVLTMGIRDYQFGDSLKRVHWRATARSRKLQTKVFDLTTTTDIAIFLDTRTTQPSIFGSIPDLLELTVITAASIANFTITSGFRTGLYVNQRKRFPDEPMRVPPGQSTGQMQNILDSLAQVTAFETGPISRLIQNESRNLAWGSTLMVITPVVTDELLSTIYSMKRGGRKVVLVSVGGPPLSVSANDLSVFHVSDTTNWRDLETITLRGS